VINPDECIDCGACEPECPTEAIFEEGDLPDRMAPYKEINAVYSGAKSVDDADTTGWPQRLIEAASTWPQITKQKEPLPGADEAQNEKDKLKDLSPSPGGD
jgi:ferredoxin